MAININNDYVEFRVTDTLHQLVDRLNTLTGLIDSNIRLFDSSVNNLLLVVDSEGTGIEADSDLVITTTGGKIDMDADSSINISAGTNLTLSATQTVTVDAGDRIFLDADSGEILLRANGTQFGALKKSADGNYLEFYSGLNNALSFDSTVSGIFSAGIVMPSSGTYTPVTAAKTVHGAINEIKSEHDSDHADHETRIGALEPLVTGLRTDVDNNRSLINDLDSDLTVQQALNIESRLATIESQIIQINNRLDILEIFT